MPAAPSLTISQELRLEAGGQQTSEEASGEEICPGRGPVGGSNRVQCTQMCADVTSHGCIPPWVPARLQEEQSQETAGVLLSSVPWGLALMAPHLLVACAFRAGLFGGLCPSWVRGAGELFQQAGIKRTTSVNNHRVSLST